MKIGDLKPGMVVAGVKVTRVLDGDRTPFAQLPGVHSCFDDPVTVYWRGGCEAFERDAEIAARLNG
jgi:hypothetical protein